VKAKKIVVGDLIKIEQDQVDIISLSLSLSLSLFLSLSSYFKWIDNFMI
jgi:hypothetical protein